MNISARTKVCMVIGDPVEHSLSPQIHNSGYKKLGISSEFVFVACHIKTKNLKDFIKGAKIMGVVGISCTAPHKTEVMKYLNEVDSVAQKIGAVNTVVNSQGFLKGYNTDWQGALLSLKRVTNLKNKNIILIGAGGAARAIAYGLSNEEVELSIFNRTTDKAKQLASKFGGKAYSHCCFSKMLKHADIIINASSLGLAAKNNIFFVDPKYILKNQVVFDLVYTPDENVFITQIKKKGVVTITGREMLLQQGIIQFKLYTGREAPEQAMRETILSVVNSQL